MKEMAVVRGRTGKSNGKGKRLAKKRVVVLVMEM